MIRAETNDKLLNITQRFALKLEYQRLKNNVENGVELSEKK